MAGISIQITGTDIVQRLLLRLHASLENLQPVHERIALQLWKWIQKNFQEGGTERPWAPLKEGTILGRRRKSSVPLQDSGRLRQSFTYRATATEAVVGSADPRAEWHHKGTAPYTIYPRNKKALAFPSPHGKVKSAVGTQKFLRGEKRGKGGFTTFRGAGRSKKDFARLPFLVVKKVRHPGLPARPLLPSPGVAQDIAVKTVAGYIRDVLTQRGGG